MTLLELLYSGLLISIFAIIGNGLLQARKSNVSASPVMPWMLKESITVSAKHLDRDGNHNIADLGSGWGGPACAFGNHFRKSKITGFEISLWPRLVSQWRSLFFRGRMRITNEDFTKTDLSAFNLLFCYLSPKHMKDLIPQLRKMKPGSLIISCSFAIPGWTPISESRMRGLIPMSVYLYRV